MPISAFKTYRLEEPRGNASEIVIYRSRQTGPELNRISFGHRLRLDWKELKVLSGIDDVIEAQLKETVNDPIRGFSISGQEEQSYFTPEIASFVADLGFESK